MHHLYLSYQPSGEALSAQKAILEGWCGKEGVREYEILLEELTSGRIFRKQVEALVSGVKAGDTVVSVSLSRLGRSFNMMVAVMRALHERGALLYVLDTDTLYAPDRQTLEFIETLEYAAALNTTIKTERSNEAVAKSRARGVSLGRPFGARKAPEKNVLFGHETQILKMRSQGVPVAKIASSFDVSAATIYNFLKSHRLRQQWG